MGGGVLKVMTCKLSLFSFKHSSMSGLLRLFEIWTFFLVSLRNLHCFKHPTLLIHKKKMLKKVELSQT